jgi:hypothetical protein
VSQNIGRRQLDDINPAPVVRIRVPGLRGPVHDWFLIPQWLDHALHSYEVDHIHWTKD